MLTHVLSTIGLVFNYINISVTDMREKPSQESEVVSQALFSEPVTIIEETDDWLKIETTLDNYRGWVKKNAVCQRQEKFLSSPGTLIAKVDRLAAHVYSVEDTVYGPILTLPFESRLEVLGPHDAPQSRWIKVALPDGSQAFIQRGDVVINPSLVSREEICALSQRFLGLPYTWGGRSSFGYDCSGFIQMLYRQMGVYLPRDSKDQYIWEGFEEISEDALKPGDLMYWGYTVDKIRHVGLYLGEGRFIHATAQENAPYLRISRLTDPEWNGFGKYPYRAPRALKK